MDIRFHLDENIHGGIARGLARRGIDVTTTGESGLLGAADRTQLDFAASAGRVLVTHDADDLALAAGGVRHAGIAYRHPEGCSVGDMVHALTELWRTRTAEEMVDQRAPGRAGLVRNGDPPRGINVPQDSIRHDVTACGHHYACKRTPAVCSRRRLAGTTGVGDVRAAACR